MGHGDAESMLQHFKTCIEDLNHRNILQVSMDGPNVNKKFHRLFQESITTQFNHILLDVGTCGLHTVHNAFKDGMDAAGWPVQKLLSGLYYLFKESPARREDYTTASGSSQFPLKFCNHRWLENILVAERALEVLPNVEKYIESVQHKKCTEPKCSSYEVVTSALKDPQIVPKLLCFISIAKILKPFLTNYQTDRPMVPFVAMDLYRLCRNAMSRFITDSAMAEITSIVKLVNFDFEDKSKYKQHRKIDLGFEAENKLVGSDRQRMDIKMECMRCLKKIVLKIIDKSPLKYPIARHLSCLDPRKMAESKEMCVREMRKLLKILTDAGRVASSKCDNILSQLGEFIDTVVTSNKSVFADFQPANSTQRLDELMSQYLSTDNFRDLWQLVKLLLVLSHGQATVERGFSVNREVVTDNQKQQNVIAQRIVCNHVERVGGIFKVELSHGLLASCASARQKYHEYLEKERRQKEQETKNLKRKGELQEIEELKRKRQALETDINSLTKAADEFANKAETTRNISCITKSNALRRTAKEKTEELKEVKKDLNDKLETLSKF